MIRRFAASAVMAAMLTQGCGPGTTPQLVVVIDSDLVIPTELDGLTIRVRDAQGAVEVERPVALGAGALHYSLPGSFGIAPLRGDVSRRVTIEIEARLGSCTMFTYRAETGFLADRRLRFDVFLSRSCRQQQTPGTCRPAISCLEPTVTCTRGGPCLPASVAPETLADFVEDGGAPD